MTTIVVKVDDVEVGRATLPPNGDVFDVLKQTVVIELDGSRLIDALAPRIDAVIRRHGRS